MNIGDFSPRSFRSIAGLSLAMFAGLVASGNATSAEPPVEAVEGLWDYTGLVTSKGDDLPLTGVILFKDGLFVQQSIFNGEPLEDQDAMAHAGTYTEGTNGIHLVAEQTIFISPGAELPLTFRPNTEHDISVDAQGDEMTLVFGSGTVQTFELIGEGESEIHRLEHGMIAFMDGYFVLVSGTSDGVTTGYGTFERHSESSFELDVIRWAETDGSEVSYRGNGGIEATFDGTVLRLDDGQAFRVQTSM